MSAAVLGIGTALPPRSIAQRDAAELAKAFCGPTREHAELLPVLYRRTGIRKRGSVLLGPAPGNGVDQSFFPPAAGAVDRGPTTRERMQRYAQEAPVLALEAAQRKLGASDTAPRQITHLLTVSCTGFVAPGVDIALIKQLDLPSSIGRAHIGFMGCHGALNGLRIAEALVSADPAARALLCAVELCSLQFRYGSDPEHAVANALFADGAAALVAAPSAQGSSEAWRTAAFGSYLFPDSEDAMTWRIGDHGFEMTLSARVPDLIAAHLRGWLVAWLTQQGLALERIGSWAVHPGGPRLLNTVAACLGLSTRALAASRAVLTEYGNMSSPTVLFILDRLRKRHAPRPCVALGFGPGLVVEAALFV